MDGAGSLGGLGLFVGCLARLLRSEGRHKVPWLGCLFAFSFDLLLPSPFSPWRRLVSDTLLFLLPLVSSDCFVEMLIGKREVDRFCCLSGTRASRDHGEMAKFSNLALCFLISISVFNFHFMIEW